MKKLLLLIAILAAAALTALFVMGRASRSGEAPGLVEGRLARCPGKPNCVCSEYRDEQQHFIEPLEIKTTEARGEITAKLHAVIVEAGGAIEIERPDYIAATFTSAWFGFVDDLEVRIDGTAALMHFRSASRVGRGDLGVNRQRVEALRQRIRQVFDGV